MAAANIKISVVFSSDAEEVKDRIRAAFKRQDPADLEKALAAIIGLPDPPAGFVKALERHLIFYPAPDNKDAPGHVYDRREAGERAAALIHGILELQYAELQEGGK